MKKIFFDEKKGLVRLLIDSHDDFWYVSQLIDPGDVVSGKTYRKVKMGGDAEKTRVEKKPITLSLEVEKVEFSKTQDALRILGLVTQAEEDIPKGAYHSLTITENYELTLTKTKWLSFHKERLEQATQTTQTILITLLDREQVVFAITKNYGYEVLSKVSGEVQKKDERSLAKGSFYEEIIKLINEYVLRFKLEHIIIASPAFWKDEFAKHIKDQNLKKKIVFALCHDVSEQSIKEVLVRPEVQTILKQERSAKEMQLIGTLLEQISKQSKVAYGMDETQKAADAGAIETILVTDELIRERRMNNTYERLDQLFQLVDAGKGTIHIISTDHEGGKTLAGLGGMGALLRFNI